MHYLGALGMPGLTAYVGLLRLAELREGDVVFVSGAAGAVGSMAARSPSYRGHTVIGSAGSPEKVALLLGELGFDAAFDYHDGPVAELLAQAAPDGIDVYFDNVGGEHLEAAIGAMRLHGRVAMCGAIAGYNDRAAAGPAQHLADGGQAADDPRLHGPRPRATCRRRSSARSRRWLADGSIVVRETIVEGLEHAPQAFIDLLRGGNTGKMLVKLVSCAAPAGSSRAPLVALSECVASSDCPSRGDGGGRRCDHAPRRRAAAHAASAASR